MHFLSKTFSATALAWPGRRPARRARRRHAQRGHQPGSGQLGPYRHLRDLLGLGGQQPVRRPDHARRRPEAATRPGHKWEYLDDNKRLRFTLRQGVKFHNGEPFNAEAVKFTFDRLLGAEGAKGPQKSNYDSIGEVKVVDENTVDFILKQPDPVLLTKLAGYGAMIVPPKYIQEKGEDNFNTHPVGTGPFVRELPAQGQRDPGAQRRILGRQAQAGQGGLPFHRRARHPGRRAAGRPRRHRHADPAGPDRDREEVRQRRRHLDRRSGGFRPALQHQDRHHQQPRRAPRADHGRGPRRHRQAAAAGPGQDHRQLPGTAVVRLQPRAEAPALQSRRSQEAGPPPA